jgi:hypothetical protein
MAVGDVLKLVDVEDYQRLLVNVYDYASLNACVTAIGGANKFLKSGIYIDPSVL